MTQAPTAVSREINYVEAYCDVDGEEKMKARYFSYRIPAGLVAGVRMTVHFSVEGTATEVWPFLKDFNAWTMRSLREGLTMEARRKWREGFIPTLRHLVADARRHA
jgi:hypothetical protein